VRVAHMTFGRGRRRDAAEDRSPGSSRQSRLATTLVFCGTFVPRPPRSSHELDDVEATGDVRAFRRRKRTLPCTSSPFTTTTTELADLQELSERMMGLEPTTFCRQPVLTRPRWSSSRVVKPNR
jgi:hypothetical protein